ncbi:hypothetical protein FUA48_08405 [Flavobacterium alkalisoli]|uniref:DUF4349 domain-containing protein n=1 Tax=Flavobacterium alkalisoli TaxID=2602769 RepID=A0A5B9FTP9_9FLAO|nr:hypothetical protein [Flavobacterium alkalisoli]QEE49601.1 hypothetical protein FUA48_08405 [Flavobacterium alkalisoli]
MRKIKSTWPILFLFALFFSVLASGCRTQKVLKEEESTVNIDSLTQVISKLTEVNREIKDKASFYFPDVNTGNSDCDSLCNARVREILKSINREIESGNNRYQLLYNEHKKTLEVLADIAATQNVQSTEQTDHLKKESSEIIKEVPVRVIPAFYKYSACFGWVCAFFLINYLISKIKTWLPKKLFT